MNASESKKKMKDVELAFFPTVVAASQYYVIVFNLLKANAVILDNEKHDDYNKYKEVFDSVSKMIPFCFLNTRIRLKSTFTCAILLSVFGLDRRIGKEGCATWVLRANTHGEVGVSFGTVPVYYGAQE
uniref:Peptidase C48, SUMO/sentrin/Ubl1 n=1 Tax=Tanacetum cinerariifolium TaxID=118510 RepID=A0A699HZJ9_TANCI|nr:peptidase C48, SUMO/sentrin/Ubl1 [Tanacetum cinerariifolium]